MKRAKADERLALGLKGDELPNDVFDRILGLDGLEIMLQWDLLEVVY